MTKTIQLFILILLFSCTDKSTKTSYNFVGKWELDELEIGFVHAVIKVPFDESSRINSDFINSDFRIDFANDLTFKIENKDKSIDEGTYHYSSDSIVLSKGNYDWLIFTIKEQTDTILKLSTNGIRFYHIENDSIEYFTGDKVKMKFKKAGNKK